MVTRSELIDASPTLIQEIERRRESRIEVPFPASVRGTDAFGDKFDIDTTIDNFSSGGLYLRLSPRVDELDELFIVSRLSTIHSSRNAGPIVLIRGRVLRVEPKLGGVYGVAVEIHHHRFF